METVNKRGRKKKETDYNNIFSVRLRELINERKVTQQEISENITASRQALNKWVNGETVPDILAAAELADYFGVSLDYLTGRGTTRSSDEDMVIARKVTGLSEASINTIKIINENFDIIYCTNMDILFENSDFMDMIHELAYAVIQAQALAGCKRELESMDNLSEYVSNTGFAEGTGRDYIFHNREYLVSKYRLEEIFKKICSDITSQATGFEYSDLVTLNTEKELNNNAQHNPEKE